jgi:hypothetical protein
VTGDTDARIHRHSELRKHKNKKAKSLQVHAIGIRPREGLRVTVAPRTQIQGVLGLGEPRVNRRQKRGGTGRELLR